MDVQLMAEEAGLRVDVHEYNQLMEEQRERSRAAGRGSAGSALKFEAEATAHLASSSIPRTDDSPKWVPCNAWSCKAACLCA